MNFKTVNCEDGEAVQLQADLSASEVDRVGSGVLAVAHDSDTTQAEYERRITNVSGPENADFEIPDNIVIVEMSRGEIDYLVRV